MEHVTLPARVSHLPSYKARVAGVRTTFPRIPPPLVSVVRRVQATHTRIVEASQQVCSDMLPWVNRHWVLLEQRLAPRPPQRRRRRRHQLPLQLQQQVKLFRRLVPNLYQAALLAPPLPPRLLLLLPVLLL